MAQTVVDSSFPKSARILKRGHFSQLHRAPHKFVGKQLVFDYRLGKSSCARLGLTVSRKYGKSHERNRFKRLVREAFRLLRPHLPSDIEMNILPQRGLQAPDFSLIHTDFQELIVHAKRTAEKSR